jgi:hypothetical protein
MVYIPPPSTHTQTHTAAKYICLFRKNLIFWHLKLVKRCTINSFEHNSKHNFLVHE